MSDATGPTRRPAMDDAPQRRVASHSDEAFRARLPTGAAAGFALAVAGLAGMLALVLAGRGDAVATIAGLGGGGADAEAMRWARAADTLLPIGYAAGFALLAAALSPGRAAAAGAVVALTVLGVAADFVENALAPLPAATTAKFGALGAAGFVLVAMLPGGSALHGAARALGWVGTPVALAGIAAGVPLALDPLGFVLALIATFGLLGVVAWRLR